MDAEKADIIKRFDLPMSLKDHFELISLKRNEYLFKQGDPIHHVYYIISGKVTVYNIFVDGATRRIVYLNVGEIIGEMEAFSGKDEASFTVQAFEPSRLIKIESQVFLDALKEDLHALYAMTVALASKLYTSSREVYQHVQNDSVGILGLFIVNTVKDQFDKQPGLQYFTIPHTRPNIADECSISERTVNRSIKSLYDMGYINLRKGKITIDRHQFSKLLQSGFLFESSSDNLPFE